MATIADDLPSADDPKVRGVFVRQVNYIRLLVLTLGEVAKELYQRERQRSRGVEPTDPPRPPLRARAGPDQRLAAQPHDGPRHRGDVRRRAGDLRRLHRLRRPRPPRRSRAGGGGRCARRARPDDRQPAPGRRARRTGRTSWSSCPTTGSASGAPFSERYGERLEDVAKKLIGDTTERPTLRRRLGVPRDVRDDPRRDRSRAGRPVRHRPARVATADPAAPPPASRGRSSPAPRATSPCST